MTLRKLIQKHRYKEIFNIIYKEYYRSTPTSKVEEADRNFYSAWNELKSYKECEPTNSYKIFITETEDDLEIPPQSFIDVCIYDSDKDEIFALDLVSWTEIIDSQILNATTIEEKESLAHILWEITFYGFTDSKISKERALLKKESSKIWKELSKQLKDIL